MLVYTLTDVLGPRPRRLHMGPTYLRFALKLLLKESGLRCGYFLLCVYSNLLILTGLFHMLQKETGISKLFFNIGLGAKSL